MILNLQLEHLMFTTSSYRTDAKSSCLRSPLQLHLRRRGVPSIREKVVEPVVVRFHCLLVALFCLLQVSQGISFPTHTLKHATYVSACFYSPDFTLSM